MKNYNDRNNVSGDDDFQSYSRYGKHGQDKYSTSALKQGDSSGTKPNTSASSTPSYAHQDIHQGGNNIHSPFYQQGSQGSHSASPYGNAGYNNNSQQNPTPDTTTAFNPIPDYSNSPKTNLENLSPFSNKNSNSSGDYSRAQYGSHAQGSHLKKKQPLSLGKKIAIGVAAFIGVIIISVSAYGLWFMNELNALLSPNSKEAGELEKVLSEPNYDKPFYALVLGSDSREASGVDGEVEDYALNREHSDVVMLLRIDAPNKIITMVSVPRDTPVDMPDGSVIKLNEVYTTQGAAGSVSAVKQITGADIAHICDVRLSEMEKIVDHLGGIEVNVDRKLSVNYTLTGERIELEPGKQTLNGKQAQAFLRARHAYADTDNQEGSRQKNVRDFMQAIIKKALHKPLPELPGTILDLAHYITSDATSNQFLDLGMRLNGSNLKVYSCSGPSKGAIMDKYDGKWMCYRNPEGWKALMEQVNSGKEPQKINYDETAIVE